MPATGKGGMEFVYQLFLLFPSLRSLLLRNDSYEKKFGSICHLPSIAGYCLVAVPKPPHSREPLFQAPECSGGHRFHRRAAWFCLLVIIF